MRAVTYTRFGAPEVLQLVELAKPAPKDDEVLIQVHATTVTAGDWRARTLIAPKGFALLGRLFFGITKPRNPILGTELSGVIESIGESVTRFKVGDEVFAYPGAAMGCYVEYRCLRQSAAIAIKPANLTHQEAAALSFGGTTALAFLRKADIQSGERVLVNGASGGVGTAAVQLAKHFGAEVTAVCSSANLELVRSIGADRAIDYTKEDFTRSGETWDVIVDTAGTAPYSRCKNSLAPRGRLLLVLATLPQMLSAPFAGKKVIAGPVGGNADDLRFLADLAASGKFKPVIDRSYPLDEIADAHRHVDTGHKRGNVVVTVR